jgi:GNAT superfamily N-acetyltransferase
VKVPERFKVGITRYTADDAADLAEFQLRTFGAGTRQVDSARAAWLFDRNPCRTEDATRDLWVCRRNGAIVGQQAEIPFDLRVGDHEHRAAWAIDLMVDDAWRLRGVGPALVATQLEGRSIVAGLNLSDKGHATYTRGGWTDLGVVPVYLRPLDLARAARLGTVPGRVEKVAPVAGPVLRAIDSAAIAALRGAGARLEPVDRFDERVDEVWRASAAHHPVATRRDLAMLRWRIDQRPDRDALHRHLLVVRGRALGYVVMRFGGTAAAPTLVIVDYLAPPRWVGPMLLAAGVAGRRDGAIAMSVKTRNEPADRYLRAAGFVRRERGTDDPVRFMVHCTDDERVCALVEDPDRWFVTSADSDLEYAMTPATASAVTPSPAASPATTQPPPQAETP